MHWFAICTKPHQEKQAELNIRQLGLESFLPLAKETRIIRRVRKTVISPFFPGYLFVRFDPMEHYRAVKYAKGVRNIVEFGLSPAIVDDSLIESIRSRVHNGLLSLPNDSLRMGQVVRIERGPLEGLKAVFERQLNGSQRVMLLLQAITYQARLVVPLKLLSNE